MKTAIDGVFSSRDILSWPIFQPKVLFEIVPQIIDSYPRNFAFFTQLFGT